MTAPLVSVLIPTYNGERFLRRTLRSALDQSHREIEVLVGDDASTDSTPEVLAAVAAADPRVRVLRHETNVGAYENPARLLAEARGEYVKFLLHDDLLMRDCVRDLVRGMESVPGATLAFSRRAVVDADGRPAPGTQPQPLSDRPGTLDGRELGDLVLSNCRNVIGELTTVLFRREDVDPEGMWEVDGHRLAATGDLRLSLSLLARGPAFYSPRTLSNFRLHETQRSQDGSRFVRGVLDWPLLIDWGRRQGFLADPAQQRAAFATALRVAADNYATLPPGPATVAGLEAAHLCTVALAALEGTLPQEAGTPLAAWAHGPGVLAGLARPMDDAVRD